MRKNGTVYNFAYDVMGNPMMILHNGNRYYYLVNARGDVEGILNSAGTLVVEYRYDAWGRLLSTSGSMASTLGLANPLRYRGYVYDRETGLYYLQSRYYNPEVGRFINADAYASTGQGILSNNMFAYCLNNPVNMLDSTGYRGECLEYILHAFQYIAVTAMVAFVNIANALESSSLPPKGDPNSSKVLNNPDGSPKQKRWYDNQGNPIRDRDYNHSGDMQFPHDHEWENGRRQPEHLPPDPSYQMTGNPLLGVEIVVTSIACMAIILADDLTGIGVADDFLLAPLGSNIGLGLIMIFA